MRVLVACEFSARVRDAFRARGHDAWSVDLLPTIAHPAWHIQGDIRRIGILPGEWDLLIAFPPCTYLSKAGARYWASREELQERALDLVYWLMAAPVPRIAIENPVGRISSAIRQPEQIIQPYWFGDPWRKLTCLWLDNLPPLEPTDRVRPLGHWIGGDRRKTGRHRDSRQRSLTFPGIARAMADQWGTNGQADERTARPDRPEHSQNGKTTRQNSRIVSADQGTEGQ